MESKRLKMEHPWKKFAQTNKYRLRDLCQWNLIDVHRWKNQQTDKAVLTVTS